LGYNDLLYRFGLEKECEPIHHGQKIKWVYLQQNEHGLETCALKGDGSDHDKMLEFVTQHVDRKAMFEQELKSKLIDFYDVFRWTFPSPSMKLAATFFEF
jgi:hypothetical protein